jgi:PKD repeat protein
MKTMLKALGIAAFGAVIAVASGCEDSPVTAGKDDKLSVIAVPPTIRSAPYTSTIIANVATITGTPRKGVLVFFSADGGEMDSAGQPVRTDSNGNAYDNLTIDPDGPGNIPVIASSTSLSESVTVTNGACSANQAPTAHFTAGAPVLVVGTGTMKVTLTDTSVDTGGAITSWNWNCGNATSGGTEAIGTCIYTAPTAGSPSKSYTVTLTVEDNGLGETAPPYSCQKSAIGSDTVTIPPLPQ